MIRTGGMFWITSQVISAILIAENCSVILCNRLGITTLIAAKCRYASAKWHTKK